LATKERNANTFKKLVKDTEGFAKQGKFGEIGHFANGHLKFGDDLSKEEVAFARKFLLEVKPEAITDLCRKEDLRALLEYGKLQTANAATDALCEMKEFLLLANFIRRYKPDDEKKGHVLRALRKENVDVLNDAGFRELHNWKEFGNPEVKAAAEKRLKVFKILD